MRKFGDQRSSNTTNYNNEYGSRGGYNRPRPERGERKDGWQESRGGQRGERKDRGDDYPRKSYNQGGGGGGDRRQHDDRKEGGYSRGGGRFEKDSYRRDEGSRYGGGGGGRGGGSRPQGGGNFGSRPSGNKSLAGLSLPAAQAKEQTCQLLTNQFRLSVKHAPPIFQYPISLEPVGGDMHIDDEASNTGGFTATTSDIEKVVARNRTKIQMIVGTYFHSGMNIWTTQKLEDSIAIDVTMLGKPYMLRVSAEGELPIAPLADGVAVRGRQDCQAYSQILNIIMNQAMQSVDGMVAFGRRPRFFDHTRPVDVKELNMQIWKGFKCSAYMYENDCVFILDSCSRFLSTRSTLDDINVIYDTFAERADQNGRDMTDDDKTRFHEAVKRELIGKSIVACYGKRQTFRVADIDFESGPCSTFFNMQDGTKVSVAKYFYKEYGLKIKNKRQPMIYVKSGKDRYLKIPAELCLVDGVPDQIRSNPKDMRTLLNEVRYNPREKMDMINGMVGKLFAAGSEALAEWGISIDAEPMKLERCCLIQPELDYQGEQKLFCTEPLLKHMPVYSCKPLSERTVVLFHDREASGDVSSILRTLEGCQAQIGMSSGRIEKVPIQYPRRVLQEQQKFRDAIKRGVDDICRSARLSDPKEQLAVLFMVNHENDYHTAKKVFAEMSILTQCFTRRTGRRLNLSVASNIMKQLNQKTGGEHIRVNLPKAVTAAKTMVIGIDVCHAGKHSVCGFAASTNAACTSYYSDFIIQPKNQELVKRDLDQCLKGALQEFAATEKCLPTKIVIFRDGVGEQMRAQIERKEVGQFRDAIAKYCNKAAMPKITIVFVNKRINQRMFLEDRRNRDGFANPEPGTILDQKLVENNDGNKQFDFFLVPQQTTQGCVTPVHYFVSLNESEDLSKPDIENLTYALCYMYSNWAGSIKVPAPCQLAHKIADYHHGFDLRGDIKKFGRVEKLQLGYQPAFCNKLSYL